MANILSWVAAALLGAASAVVLALLVWNGFLYLEYLRQPPLARQFSHGSFAPVGDDDDWTFKPQFAENAAIPFGSSGASATRYGRIEDVHILPIVVAECEGGVLVLRKRSQRDASSAKPSAIVTLNAVGRMLVGSVACRCIFRNARTRSGLSAQDDPPHEGRASAHRSLHLHFCAFQLRPTAWLG
jgi:hypothetical protein